MKKVLKKHGKSIYPLYLNFKSPIGDIFQHNEEMREELLSKGFLDNNSFSSVASIVSGITAMLLIQMPEIGRGYDYFSVINGILLGEMHYEYYTSGSYGEKLIRYLDEIENDKYDSRLLTQANFSRNKFEYEYLEEFKGSNLFGNIHTKNYHYAIEYHEIEEKYYKLSKRGYAELKGINIDEEIIKGLKECYVKGRYIADFRILDALIAYVYFDMKLYIYFNPQSFELGICDKENLDFNGEGNYIVANFGTIIDQILGKRYIDELRQKSSFKKLMNTNDNSKILNALNIACKELGDIVTEHQYDDFTLTLDGYVNNLNRFHELDEKTRFGNISFSKYANKKQRINVTSVKTLKGVLKSLKNK